MFDDVLWGNVVHVVGENVVEVHITYQPTLNRGSYQTLERVRLIGASKESVLQTMPSISSTKKPQLERLPNQQDELLGRNLLLRVLERDQEHLHCEVNMML